MYAKGNVRLPGGAIAYPFWRCRVCFQVEDSYVAPCVYQVLELVPLCCVYVTVFEHRADDVTESCTIWLFTYQLDVDL